MRFRSLLPLLAALALPALSGCDEDPNGLDLDGEFVASVTGDVAAALSGEAVYTVFDTARGPRFALLFFRDDVFDNDREEYAYVALHRAGTRPGVGVYPIGSDEPSGEAFAGSFADLVEADEPDAEGFVLTATGGVLTLTHVDPAGFLTGSFRFDGTGLALPDTGRFITASVDGTFEARFMSAATLRGLDIDFDFD